MKIITFACALDHHTSWLDKPYYCHQGRWDVPNSSVWVKDDTPHDTLTAKGIFTHSSNIGTYKMARELGSKRLRQHAQQFGYGSATALNLTGQLPGKLKPLTEAGDWPEWTLRSASFGYEVETTVLQVACAVGAVTNGGARMKPRLVDRIETSDGRVVPVAPERVAQACKSSTAKHLMTLMRSVVDDGSGTLAQIPGYEVGGKTGTAQLMRPNDRGVMEPSHEHRVVWFAGYVMEGDRPLVCIVMSEDPKIADKNMIYGGKYAAPIFKDIVTRALDIRSAHRESNPLNLSARR
jgi:cell division protein FtsI (penicillin-binding protein 3)